MRLELTYAVAVTHHQGATARCWSVNSLTRVASPERRILRFRWSLLVSVSDHVVAESSGGGVWPRRLSIADIVLYCGALHFGCSHCRAVGPVDRVTVDVQVTRAGLPKGAASSCLDHLEQGRITGCGSPLGDPDQLAADPILEPRSAGDLLIASPPLTTGGAAMECAITGEPAPTIARSSICLAHLPSSLCCTLGFSVGQEWTFVLGLC